MQLPAEESENGKGAKLNKAMYGTREAAQNWAWEYRTAHEEWGSVVGNRHNVSCTTRLGESGWWFAEMISQPWEGARIWIGSVHLSPPALEPM